MSGYVVVVCLVFPHTAFQEPDLAGHEGFQVFVGDGEEILYGQSVFRDDGFRAEVFSENFAGILGKEANGIFSRADGGRGSHGTDLAFGDSQLQFQTADQIGHIGPLCTIVGVQFVQDQKLQERRIFQVVGPQRMVLVPHQGIVQHLEVGEQDVRRAFQDRVPILDDVVLAHLLGEFLLVFALADEQTRSDLALETPIVPDGLRQSLGLVGGQGVHRI